MASRAFQSGNDHYEEANASNAIAPLPAPEDKCTEIITGCYNPEKEFWQCVPKLPDEKPPKIPKEEIKIDFKHLKAKAIARVEQDKLLLLARAPAVVVAVDLAVVEVLAVAATSRSQSRVAQVILHLVGLRSALRLRSLGLRSLGLWFQSLRPFQLLRPPSTAQPKAKAKAKAHAKAKGERAARNTKGTFAGRRPPSNPQKLAVFLKMKELYHETKSKLATGDRKRKGKG
eukprot:s5158_g6.t1